MLIEYNYYITDKDYLSNIYISPNFRTRTDPIWKSGCVIGKQLCRLYKLLTPSVSIGVFSEEINIDSLRILINLIFLPSFKNGTIYLAGDAALQLVYISTLFNELNSFTPKINSAITTVIQNGVKDLPDLLGLINKYILLLNELGIQENNDSPSGNNAEHNKVNILNTCYLVTFIAVLFQSISENNIQAYLPKELFLGTAAEQHESWWSEAKWCVGKTWSEDDTTFSNQLKKYKETPVKTNNTKSKIPVEEPIKTLYDIPSIDTVSQDRAISTCGITIFSLIVDSSGQLLQKDLIDTILREFDRQGFTAVSGAAEVYQAIIKESYNGYLIKDPKTKLYSITENVDEKGSNDELLYLMEKLSLKTSFALLSAFGQTTYNLKSKNSSTSKWWNIDIQLNSRELCDKRNIGINNEDMVSLFRFVSNSANIVWDGYPIGSVLQTADFCQCCLGKSCTDYPSENKSNIPSTYFGSLEPQIDNKLTLALIPNNRNASIFHLALSSYWDLNGT